MAGSRDVAEVGMEKNVNKNTAQITFTKWDGKSLKCVTTVEFILAFDLRQCNKYIRVNVFIRKNSKTSYATAKGKVWN